MNANLPELPVRDPSFRPDCPACDEHRRHTTEERMRFHPLAGHGCIDGHYTCAEAHEDAA